jgi:23S rRNA pseudouridine2605 synthase
MTAPARIRLLRDADNPWYEMILIEGRNREIRKMFEEIGHHVEKIRRVGYGPLVLDVEPGRHRELTPEEVAQLRRAAEGKSPARPARDRAIRLPKAERRPRPRSTPRKSARPASRKRPISGKRTRRP